MRRMTRALPPAVVVYVAARLADDVKGKRRTLARFVVGTNHRLSEISYAGCAFPLLDRFG
jgi:hypothetical protein